MDGWVDEWLDRWVDGWIGGCMDVWMNGWMDGSTIVFFLFLLSSSHPLLLLERLDQVDNNRRWFQDNSVPVFPLPFLY